MIIRYSQSKRNTTIISAGIPLKWHTPLNPLRKAFSWNSLGTTKALMFKTTKINGYQMNSIKSSKLEFLSACLPACLSDNIWKTNDATHGHQTLPQLQTHQRNVPFQIPKFVCPLCLVPSFILRIMVIFIMLQSHSNASIFQIDTFHIRHHKIIRGFNISCEILVHP